MGSGSLLIDLVRLSSELVQESAKLKKRARETMSETSVIIDRSRELLSLWPVSGTPTLPEKGRAARPVASHEFSLAGSQSPDAQAGTDLERVIEQNFAGETLRLDGRHFLDCNVEDCILEYWGGPVILEGTNFRGCRFRFGGEAAMTVSMLQCFGLLSEGHARSVESVRGPAGTDRVN